MQKIDCSTNEWVADWTVTTFEFIANATADCEEDYSVSDVTFSAETKSGLKPYPMEVKRIMGEWQIKYDDVWNPYFDLSNPDGMMRRLKLEKETPPCHYAYFVNAEDIYGNEDNGKWKKLLDANACLAFVAPDGLLIYSPKMLKEAFMGFGWYYNRSHTEQYGKKIDPHWEKKAIIDLEKGAYYKATPPIELFIKNG